jgi:hypothetical protein
MSLELPLDPDKLAAALERLEAERDRRLNERLEKGEAVRAPVIVVGAEVSIDAAHNRMIDRLRAAGEKREIVCPQYETQEDGELREAIDVIITGVPRAGREPDNYTPPPSVEPPAPYSSIYDRRSPPTAGRQARVDHVVDDVKPPIERTEPPTAPEGKRIWAQTAQPSQANPGGSIAEGSYRVEGALLTVEDLRGNLLGRAAVKPGDDVEAMARKILREKKVNDFYRPIYH